jgi:hypothetical protein
MSAPKKDEVVDDSAGINELLSLLESFKRRDRPTWPRNRA